MTVKRIGLIVPSSNTTMEVDFYRNLPIGVTLHTDRMYLTETLLDQEKSMVDDYLMPAVRNLATIKSDVIVFGCTSGGTLNGIGYEGVVSARIKKVINNPIIMVINAVKKVLKEIGCSRIGIFTPYVKNLHSLIEQNLIYDGLSIVKSYGLGIISNLDIGAIEPGRIKEMALEYFKGLDDMECLFISCTNFRAAEVADDISLKIGKPVVTSNQAALKIALSML